MSVASANLSNALPAWYLANRVHAHTRLSITGFCHNTTVEGADDVWTCKPIFEHAAGSLSTLGVPAYVRHTHTASEGVWWPSTTDPPDAWHPMVRATNRSLPREFLDEAKPFGMHVISYHYMKCQGYYAKTRPEWVQRWPNGSSIEWQRGTGLSPCSTAWQNTYIAQVLQLVAMGYTAFYFDEYPASKGGDWNVACQRRFEQLHGEPMPTALVSDKGAQPVAVDRRVALLMTLVTEEFFSKLADAITAANPRAASLISIYRVPEIDDGGGLYETTALLSPLGAVAKTEDHIAAQVRPPRPGDDPYEPDVLKSFGYSMARDAADKPSLAALSPAHLWLPALTDPARALCDAASVVAYGGIANPDHVERDIPDHGLFDSTYALGANLSRAWAARPSLRPMAHASVLFSESARNRWLPSHEVDAWQHVLYPTLGAWRALVRARVPSRLLVDWQLRAWPPEQLARRHPTLVAPPLASLTDDVAAALRNYSHAGGALVEANASEAWGEAAARPAAEARLLRRIADATGGGGGGGGGVPPPPSVRLVGGATNTLTHLVAYATATADEQELLLFVLNNFTSCFGASTGPLPPPVSGLALEVTPPDGGATVVRSATDALSGLALHVTPGEPARIALPQLRVVMAVAVRMGA